MNIPFRHATAYVALLAAGAASAASVTLSGTIRDFCAPDIANTCTRLTDFEGSIPGLVPGMVAPTLTGNVPSPGPNLSSGATNPANFAKWYRDSPGFNVSAPFSLTLNETSPGSGVFAYANGAFFPIDGQLYGNQGRGHNYHFTLHLEGRASYQAGDSFTFTGDDDLWVFLDNKLIIDLGGVHGAATQTITASQLGAMGIAADTLFDLDIFFAERHTTASNFNVTTGFTLAPPPGPTNGVPEPGSALLAGLGLAGLGWSLRRRR